MRKRERRGEEDEEEEDWNSGMGFRDAMTQQALPLHPSEIRRAQTFSMQTETALKIVIKLVNAMVHESNLSNN